jgi:hypothetical protein
LITDAVAGREQIQHNMKSVRLGAFGWSLIAGALLVSAGWVYFNYHRYIFANRISTGMSREQVMQAVGTPSAMLQPGETLDEWGGSVERKVQAETWTYFVVPQSQHRFVVTFADGKVASIVHEQN